MVVLKIDVKIYPGKFEEFTQTPDYLLQEFRLEEGCLSYVYKCQNTNPDQILIMNMELMFHYLSNEQKCRVVKASSARHINLRWKFLFILNR